MAVKRGGWVLDGCCAPVRVERDDEGIYRFEQDDDTVIITESDLKELVKEIESNG